MAYNQEIYDAVYSKISGGDIGQVVADVARDALDISFRVDCVAQDFTIAAHEMQRPSVIFKPKISLDGNMWCALLGDNIQDGVSGWGSTPQKAMWDFDRVFCGHPKPQEVA